MLNVRAQVPPFVSGAARLSCLVVYLLLASCKSPSYYSSVDRETLDEVTRSMDESRAQSAASQDGHSQPPDEVLDALVLGLALDSENVQAVEERFDFSVRDPMDARDFFSLLMEGTEYSIVVHPDVEGEVSAMELRNVTLEEALEQVSDLYGFVIRESGDIYQILPAGIQTRIFNVNYLNVRRSGTSNMQITASGITQGSQGGLGGLGGMGGLGGAGALPGFGGNTGGLGGLGGGMGGAMSGMGGGNTGGASINTTSEADYWENLQEIIESIVGIQAQEESEGGLLSGMGRRSRPNTRAVIVSPQTGMVVVKALPAELKQVEDFLTVSQNALQRQVILEAKILEVELKEGFQAGIDLNTLGDVANGPFGDGTFATSDNNIAAEFGFQGEQIDSISSPLALNFRYTDFEGVIRLLETQGNVQVISSPRISTLNNQKAVFKVGDEQYFLTSANTTIFGAGEDSTTNQNTTLEPFFSGIALDVTPQISDMGDIILHIHPILSEVREDLKRISGEDFPLANSTTRESDSVARARNGEVIVISGLMQTRARGEQAGVPGLSDIPVAGHAFEQKQRETVKTELVILLRAIVDEEGIMHSLIDEQAERIEAMRRKIDPYYR